MCTVLAKSHLQARFYNYRKLIPSLTYLVTMTDSYISSLTEKLSGDNDRQLHSIFHISGDTMIVTDSYIPYLTGLVTMTGSYTLSLTGLLTMTDC